MICYILRDMSKNLLRAGRGHRFVTTSQKCTPRLPYNMKFMRPAEDELPIQTFSYCKRNTKLKNCCIYFLWRDYVILLLSVSIPFFTCFTKSNCNLILNATTLSESGRGSPQPRRPTHARHVF